MKRYAILAGGGVKGVALAGCLAAAQDRGIDFVGYGGTSAGSIVALLASVGYSGQQIKSLMADTSFTKFLDDEGVELNQMQGMVKKVFQGIGLLSIPAMGWTIYRRKDLLKKLYGKSGLYGAGELKAFLSKCVRDKYENLAEGFNFKHLSQAGARPLKIVAADVVAHKSVVFGRNNGGDERDWSVVEAVRASASYPFVFEPVRDGSNYLSDGGVSSNLPVFLFEQERRNDGLPIMAFDLIAAPGRRPDGEYPIFEFCKDLAATSMESSDKLIQALVSGLHYVPVPVPPGIDTLKFSLSPAEQVELFNAGYAAASKYLNTSVGHWFQSSGNRIKELQAQQRIRPEAVEGTLAVIAQEWESLTGARQVRCSVVLPTGSDTQIPVYKYGMGGASDELLELNLASGWSGKAREERDVTVADLAQDAASFRKEWGLTPDEHARIPPDRKAALCLCLFDMAGSVNGEINPDKDRVLGTLCIDTATPLDQTGWGRASATPGRVFNLTREVTNRCLLWGQVLSKLLS